MTNIIEKIIQSNSPFSLIQKQDSEEVLVLTGTASKLDTIDEIPRKHSTPEEKTYDTISMIPFSQIRERGYNVIDEGDKILSIHHILTIFKALLQNDYSTYWKFVFYDGERFFIGSTPERHLYVGKGRVKMNCPWLWMRN